MDKKTTLSELKSMVEEFVAEREWEQFHNPKNLSMAISIEAAELMDIFKWFSSEDSKGLMSQDKYRQMIKDEIADIMIYCMAFANRNSIDISDIIKTKMKKNAIKYPSNIYKGRF
jgi:dCTP diphosphatase